MSQAGSLLFGGSGTKIGSTVIADVGSATADRNGELKGLGSTALFSRNITTESLNNDITVNLSSTIYVDEANIGNLKFVNNTLSSTNTNGDIIFSPNGTGKIFVSNLGANSVCYFSGTRELKTSRPTNGQLLIGATGAEPQAANLTAGSNITITNAPGSITISRTGTNISGISTWVYLDYQVVGYPYTQVMEPNVGYIVYWIGAGYDPRLLNFQFPTQSNRQIGDFYSITIIQGGGKGPSGTGPDGNGYSIAISPRFGEAIQAPYQTNKYITSPIHPASGTFTNAGNRIDAANISFVCTEPTYTGGTDGYATFEVVTSQNNWTY